MSPQDAVALDEQLQVIGHAHRLGTLSRTQYRARRRQLLAVLARPAAAGADDGATVRRPVGGGDAAAAPARPERAPPARAAGSPASARRWQWWHLVVAVLLAAFALGGGYWLGLPSEAERLAAARQQQTRQESVALDALARRFVDDNRWQAPEIDAFLQRWRAASPEGRAAALDGDGLRALQGQLAYNRKVASLLGDDAAARDGQAARRLALQRFERELAVQAAAAP